MAVEVNPPLSETRLKLDTSSPSLKFACAGAAFQIIEDPEMQVVVRQCLRKSD
jgi:hypothetical protein